MIVIWRYENDDDDRKRIESFDTKAQAQRWIKLMCKPIQGDTRALILGATGGIKVPAACKAATAGSPSRHHATKKSPAQLQREIDEVLAKTSHSVDGPPAAGWTKFHKRVHGYPISFYKTSHGQYEMFRRPSDFLVKYAAAVGNIGKIAPIENIGVYPTVDAVLSAVADHDRLRR